VGKQGVNLLVVENHIDILAVALAQDIKLSEAFLKSGERLTALQEYNCLMQRSGGKPIELTEEELELIIVIQAASIEEFCAVLLAKISTQNEGIWKTSFVQADLSATLALMHLNETAA
jgi:hypothetical protein